ncbi:unnamed protein product [Rotaria sordida]|uniref:Uncharacterized protein n=1 Tax=Rotaria sordida TaxID=392033 RepID=A0A814GXX9_9BILA|nr:unnamed protein product [Rotaria sordida]CAF1062200.1 unnamed protein product [Rotaria sordida]CAF1284518.1 unnamed protein product [Rotaria sordida]CAF1562428.1 unnamed protein product [Rotaria sordida]CAF3516702.1 unnamed protein product [Rotaria sordida]
MASTFESSQQSNYVEAQENDPITTSSLPISSNDIDESLINNSEEKNEEQISISELEDTDITTNNINDFIPDTDTTIMNSTNMITAEASFTEATSADLPLGATRSSVARILVKPGQIFRVQVDNEVKEVHGKLMCFLIKLKDKNHKYNY